MTIIGDFTCAYAVLDDVLEERKRQERLVTLGKFDSTCASAEMNDGERLAVLMEEVGEVATDTLADGSVVALRKELIQVAAVAVAWVEAIDRRIGT